MEQNSTTGSRNIMPFKMAGSEKMRIDTLGNVGIGTSAPSYLLDVYGGSGRISTPSNDGTLYLGTSTVQYKNSTNTICIGAASINTAAATGTNNLAIGNASMGSVSSGSNNTACGNTALTGTTLGSNNTGVGFSAGSGITSGTGNVYVGAASVASSGGANNEIVIGAGAVGIGNNSVVLGNDNIVTTSLNGNVGIKTKLPAAVLDVNGAVKFRGALDMTNQNISGVGSLTVSGNVGIGTSTPQQILQVGNGGRLRISNGITDYTLIGTKETDDASNTRIVLSGYDRSSNNGNIDYVATNTGAHVFRTSNSGAERMRITESGNVGIGTTTPEATLQINKTGTNKGLVIDSGSQNVTAIELSGNSAGWGSGIVFNNTTATTGKQYGMYSASSGDFFISDVSSSIPRIQITKDGTLLMSSNTIVNPFRSSQLSIGCRVAGLLSLGDTSHELVLDLVSVRWFNSSGGFRCLQIKTVGSNFIMRHYSWYWWGNGGPGTNTGTLTMNVTTTYQNFINYTFVNEGDQPNHIMWDATNNRCYRLMGIVNASFNNNITILERMYP